VVVEVHEDNVFDLPDYLGSLKQGDGRGWCLA